MLRITALVGLASDPTMADRLHDLEHHGVVETVRLAPSDMSRRRQQLRTDRGTELALMLDRDAALQHGSVLLLEPTRAIVVALTQPQWLMLDVRDTAHALELGYFAGNMHWKVRFDGPRLCIALEGPRATYLQRMAHLLEAGFITLVDDAATTPTAEHDHHPHGGEHHHHDH